MFANSSRRSFLKNSVAAGAVGILRSPALASSAGSSVIVVGAGAFGGWSALQLAQRGMRVTLVDAWGPGNSRDRAIRLSGRSVSALPTNRSEPNVE
jgi:hypothetical protein